ncbi:hypothetical protein B0H14DRAFT_2656663 [Mycena olivaceomarginata]|nr:hypothetical protein B0H14DRAFT_2656663 [Mycena olivaceomarginata]
MARWGTTSIHTQFLCPYNKAQPRGLVIQESNRRRHSRPLGGGMPAGDVKYFRPLFWSDLWPLDVAMMIVNSALIPDPNKKDVLASRPFDWLFMHLSLRICG